MLSAEYGPKQKRCQWWCAVYGGQYDWREANRVLAIHASCMPEYIRVFKVYAPFLGACDDKISELKLLVDLRENFITSSMLPSRKVAGERWCGWPCDSTRKILGDTVSQGPQALTLIAMETTGQKALVDTTKMCRNRWALACLIRTEVRCVTC